MKRLQITEYKSTGLDAAFHSSPGCIDLPDQVFVGGAFGQVYRASVNGSLQAVKLFINDSATARENARKCYRNILQLQDAVIRQNLSAARPGGKPLQQVEALRGLPLFSFKGTIGGMEYGGYSTYWLDDRWILFDRLFEGAGTPEAGRKYRKWFYSEIDSSRRLNFVKSLLEGFMVLDEIGFVFADLNPKNFFINFDTGHLCLIDYDSGSVNAEPDTIGKRGDWLAPELEYEIKNTSSRFTDYWSVAMTVHYFFFPFGPLSYLQGQNESLMRAYFRRYRYPEIGLSDPNFNPAFRSRYKEYVRALYDDACVPSPIREAFLTCFNEGYFTPGVRPTSKQWYQRISTHVQPYQAPARQLPAPPSGGSRPAFSRRRRIVREPLGKKLKIFLLALVALLAGAAGYGWLSGSSFRTTPAPAVALDYAALVPGHYSVRQRYNGTDRLIGAVAEIRSDGAADRYKAVVASEYDPVTFRFTVEPGQVLRSDQLGAGKLEYNEKLGKVTLSFEKNDLIWLFTK